MQRVFGIETEYGITVEGAESLDVVAESIELVRSYTEHGTHMKWDYQLEDPHRDARGFRATELLQDTDESAYFEIDKNRPLSFQEIKTDLVLANGARFYNDHAHPEYSTPECTTLREIVAHDKAGERIVADCGRRRNLTLADGQSVRLFKNNTDFVGHSYGCHDNYLMRRSVPWNDIVSGILPFLVTRQIFAGAGKLGIEAESAAGEPGVYQISQRSDFFSVLVSIDTMNRRPLVNTRDEPHADPRKYRRFHVIVGDANMSEWATALKIGTTALVLDLIESEQAPRAELAHAIEATKSISRDQDYHWRVELQGGRTINAVELQRLYLAAAKKLEHAGEPETAWLLREWETVLDELELDVSLARDRVDWVAKRYLLSALQEDQKLSWSDPWLQAIDLQYHNVDPEQGLFYELERQGAVRRIVSDEDIAAAVVTPPETTRAYFRGRSVAKFSKAITAVQWDEITFAHEGLSKVVRLPEIAGGERLTRLNEVARTAQELPEFFRRLI